MFSACGMGTVGLWKGEGVRGRILGTYHADAFYGICAAGVIGGVGPVV